VEAHTSPAESPAPGPCLVWRRTSPANRSTRKLARRAGCDANELAEPESGLCRARNERGRQPNRSVQQIGGRREKKRVGKIGEFWCHRLCASSTFAPFHATECTQRQRPVLYLSSIVYLCLCLAPLFQSPELTTTRGLKFMPACESVSGCVHTSFFFSYAHIMVFGDGMMRCDEGIWGWSLESVLPNSTIVAK
jgi:hypothetical protein